MCKKQTKNICLTNINLHINFDTNSAVIKTKYKNNIKKFIDFLKKYNSS